MELDTSELRGKSFQCLDNCAMCCLCQPELNEKELRAFEKANLTNWLTREHIRGHIAEKPISIKLQGDCGACHFLKNRRCTIYNLRPAFCNQFPVHVHALHRVQLNANLSCRGITEGGNSLEQFGKTVLAKISKEVMADALAVVGERLRIFETASSENGVYQIPKRLRSVASSIIPSLAKTDGIGRLLAFADSEPELGKMTDNDIVNMVLATEPCAGLEKMAREDNYCQFELDDPAWLPVYVDEKFRWNTFRAHRGKIHWLNLHEDGTLETLSVFEKSDVKLLLPQPGALRIFAAYAGLLNSRDQFLGSAYQLCADQKMSCGLMTIYLGTLATALLDLWWRASLIGLVYGKTKLDTALAKEAIGAFDMDCLDMPTMGMFF